MTDNEARLFAAAVTDADVHLNGLLTEYVHALRIPGLVGHLVFPAITVPHPVGWLPVIRRENWLRRPSALRVRGETPKAGTFEVGSVGYHCQPLGLGVRMPLELLDNSDIENLARRGAEFCADLLGIEQEIRCYSAATGVGSSVTAGVAWTNNSLSTPTTDFNVAIEGVRAITGYVPNCLLIPQLTLNALNDNPDITRDGAGSALGNVAAAAQVPVENIYVPTVRVNSAKEGQTAAYFDVWSRNAILFYKSPTPARMSPSWGYRPTWLGRGRSEGPPQLRIRQAVDDETSTLLVRGDYELDVTVVAPELGFRILTGV